MKNLMTCVAASLLVVTSFAQVGIGTTTPEGVLDVTTNNDLGIVLPRVSSVSNVTNGSGSAPVDGTLVFDVSQGKPCVYTGGKWACFGFDASGQPVVTDGTPPIFSNSGYIKASNTGSQDFFGLSVAMSGDGNTMAVGARGEGSNATGINGNQNDNSAGSSGAVYVFVKSGGIWSQEAYIKSSNSELGDRFGYSVSLNDNGNVLAVGADNEDSNAVGIGGNQSDNSAVNSGAVYIFNRNTGIWSQTAYVKASNCEGGDLFGVSLSLSGDGLTLAVGSEGEDSNATGIGGNQVDNSAGSSGAVYVFTESGGMWSQQAYIKSSNSDTADLFGRQLAISQNGARLVVGAFTEDSAATGVNGNQTDNTSNGSGAAYVFDRSGNVWAQTAYLKASNTDGGDGFGSKVTISGDGNTVAISSPVESSNATGINGSEIDNTAGASGAVYVFSESGGVWSQTAYIKASNTEAGDRFGLGLTLNLDGTKLLVGASSEDSNASGFNGNQLDNSLSNSSAVYFFEFSGAWSQSIYIKSLSPDANDFFGASNLAGTLNLDLDNTGANMVIGAYREDGGDTGIGGNPSDNTVLDSGAIFVYEN